ncbi:hypothetical protein ACRYCC_02335 [Actinomadura scrupuli]|uniref:hypothetical protein n=1 Tax=Actinomadura scrupuli TaxID=559629 RepID=UPI003D995FCD
MNRRLIVLVSVAGALLAAAVAVAVTSSEGADDRPGSGDPAGSVGHRMTENPHDVETYWTPERMREAEGG